MICVKISIFMFELGQLLFEKDILKVIINVNAKMDRKSANKPTILNNGKAGKLAPFLVTYYYTIKLLGT